MSWCRLSSGTTPPRSRPTRGRHQHQHAGGVLDLHRGQAQHWDGPGGGGAPHCLAGTQSGEADQPGGGPGPELMKLVRKKHTQGYGETKEAEQ